MDDEAEGASQRLQLRQKTPQEGSLHRTKSEKFRTLPLSPDFIVLGRPNGIFQLHMLLLALQFKFVAACH